MNASPEFDDAASLRSHILAAAVSISVLFLGMGGWAMTTEFSGAVIAGGQLVVRSEVKKVQHLTGGIVGSVLVREGSAVKAGDPLLRLDDTQARANLNIINANLDDALAREARNIAEREGHENIAFSSLLLERKNVASVAAIMAGETRLFQARRLARAGQRARLAEQIQQGQQQIQGIDDQIVAKSQEIKLIERELEGIRTLFHKNLVPLSRLTNLEREAARLTGERGQFIASLSVIRGRIAEIELQILQIDHELRNETGRELGELRKTISELMDRQTSAQETLARISIRSPQDGIVTQLSVHAPGAVITPNGEPIMLIVPNGDDLVVEAKVLPSDIDQIFVGQKAIIRFTALNQRSAPDVGGSVSLVAANVRADARTGANYYVVRLDISADEKKKLDSVALLPGMPVETFVQTKPRTVLSFLTAPFGDMLTRTFRER